jgi:biopolymer transport protein TolR
MARYVRKRKSATMIPEITLTPLIDTALTLLIIFMVTTPMIHNAIKVDLPRGKAQEDKGTVHELVVYIDKDEKLFLNGKSVTSDQLVEQLQKSVQGATKRPVMVKGDERARWGYVVGIVDQIKVIGGINYVALATQKVA